MTRHEQGKVILYGHKQFCVWDEDTVIYEWYPAIFKISDQTKNWIISSHYLDDLNSSWTQDWKPQQFWFSDCNMNFAGTSF